MEHAFEEQLEPNFLVTKEPQKPKRFLKRLFLFCIMVMILFGGGIVYTLRAPQESKTPSFFKVVSGDTLAKIAHNLKNEKYIRSEEVFRIFVILLHGDRGISVGDYYFDQPTSLPIVATRFAFGDFNVTQKKITLPEGMTRKEMAEVLTSAFPNFSTSLFLDSTKNDEGCLFPDTYFFSPAITTEEIISRLKDTFKNKIDFLQTEIKTSRKVLGDIITMASIIEKEAGPKDDRTIISGILWKRIANHMPLQVDAPFLFLLGKQSSELTKSDLALQSAYNTYVHQGLPPGPINNPGLLSIEAALYPKDSPYYFYLHGTDGQIHFAKTFEEHKKNKKLYLK